MEKQQEVLWKEKCEVCGIDMVAVRTSLDGYTMPGAKLCDRADPSGCFKPYHEACFDAHECPVHPAEEQPRRNDAAIVAALVTGISLWAYGIYLPGMYPGVWYSIAGGFILGCAVRAAAP